MAEEVQEEIKVNKFDNTGLKQALDDAVVKYLTEDLDYQEDHSLSNTKLLLGAVACLLAVLAHFYPTPFPANRTLLIFCAIGQTEVFNNPVSKTARECVFYLGHFLTKKYFICSSVLQFIASYMQQDVILFTKRSQPRKALEVSSRMNKYDYNYTLSIHYKGGKSQPVFTKPVTNWFTSDGVLVVAEFNKDVAQLLINMTSKKTE